VHWLGWWLLKYRNSSFLTFLDMEITLSFRPFPQPGRRQTNILLLSTGYCLRGRQLDIFAWARSQLVPQLLPHPRESVDPGCGQSFLSRRKSELRVDEAFLELPQNVNVLSLGKRGEEVISRLIAVY